MDLEKLRGTAVSFAQENIKQHEAHQTRMAERAEAVARLDEAMQTREEAFRGLASIAVRHSAGKAGESMAIPVGSVSVQAPSGEVVERNLYALVRNYYDDRLNEEDVNFGSVVPESVYVNFSVEAEEGDVESGLFQTTDSIGLVEADGEAKMLYGQQLEHETYHHNKVPVPKSLRATPTTTSSITLYGADIYDKEDATWLLTVVNAQLPAMRETLDLLQVGIQQSQPTIAN